MDFCVADAAIAHIEAIEELEKQYPEYASPISPTRRVGGEALSQFVKVRHAVPL